MYETFTLRQLEKGKIQGYSWPLENPDKVVCIVHGIGEYGGRFDRVAEKFREANIAVLAHDQRGHGDSIGKKGHCAPREDVLEDVSALLEYAEAKYPGKQIVLYGHSMGGNVTLDYRSRGRLNDKPCGYIISAPWIRLVRPIPKALYVLVKTLAKVVPEMTISSSVDEKILGNPMSVKPYNDNPMVHNRISVACAVDGFEIGLGLEDGTHEDNGKSAKIPTILMHGDADKICDVNGSRNIAKRLTEKGDAFEYVEWPELYHEIHNGNKESNGDEVISKMIEWVKAL